MSYNQASFMKLTVLIPAHNEESSLPKTTMALFNALSQAQIPHEILVVNDHSTDKTQKVLETLSDTIPTLRFTSNQTSGGFGLAIRWGFRKMCGDCVAIYMADASDSPSDLIRFYQCMLSTQTDAVFGTRFHPDSTVTGYPHFKLILNRLVNKLIQLLFGLRYNDVTNAFKLYKRSVIRNLEPILSHHFNLTVELPLKTIIRGNQYKVLPNDWRGRTEGYSKLNLKEMGSRYLFIILYCFLERWLSRGDYLEITHENSVSSEAPSLF